MTEPKSAAQQWRDAAENPTALVEDRDKLRKACQDHIASCDAMISRLKASDTRWDRLFRIYMLVCITCVVLGLVCLSGCAKPIRAIEKPIPEPQPDVVDNRDTHSDEESLPTPDPQGVAVQVSIPPNAWEWLQENVKCLTLTFEDEQSYVAGDGTRVDIPVGSHMKIEVDEKKALLSFSKPYPNVKWKVVFDATLNADVTAVTLLPNGDGVAKTALGITRRFRWLDDGSQVRSEASICQCGCSKIGCQCGVAQTTQETARVSTNQPKQGGAQHRYSAYFFTSDSCGPCVTFGPRFKALAANHGMAVTTVDVERQPELWSYFAAKDIRVPQVAIYVDGKLVDSLVNPTDEQVLKAMGVR